MGARLEMKVSSFLSALVLGFTLSGCGNDPQAGDTQLSLKAGVKLGSMALRLGRNPTDQAVAPAAVTALRAALEKSGQPIYLVSVADLGYANLMAPYGQNGAVQTWASTTYESVSMRDGIVVATRGFGPDMMTSVAPDAAQVARGVGSFQRSYYYLDGADQTTLVSYTCTYAQSGSETVVVLGKGNATRKVTESCAGPVSPFENAYWFDGSGKMRQSDQRLAPGLKAMRLQRVID